MLSKNIIFVIILLYHMEKLNATIFALKDIIDLSNVDLVKFRYFKNFPSQLSNGSVKDADYLLKHFQKKKAALDYLEYLLFGNSIFTPESEIVFDPYVGQAWRPYYQREFGWRGEHLIDVLGKGYASNKLHIRN